MRPLLPNHIIFLTSRSLGPLERCTVHTHTYAQTNAYTHTQHTHTHTELPIIPFLRDSLVAPQAILELLAIVQIRITGALVGYTWALVSDSGPGPGLGLRPWGLVSDSDLGAWSRTQTLGPGLGTRPWGLVSDSHPGAWSRTQTRGL